jgi:hypothetical protein
MQHVKKPNKPAINMMFKPPNKHQFLPHLIKPFKVQQNDSGRVDFRSPRFHQDGDGRLDELLQVPSLTQTDVAKLHCLNVRW